MKPVRPVFATWPLRWRLRTRSRAVEAGPKERGTSSVRSLPGDEFFTRNVSRRLTIFVCTYLLKQALQTGSVRTEIATGSVWQRLQRLVVVAVVVVGSVGGGGGESFRDGILSVVDMSCRGWVSLFFWFCSCNYGNSFLVLAACG